MGRRTTGTIITNKGKKGKSFYLKYTLNGQTKQCTLHNEDGTKCRTMAEAKAAQARLMAPLAYKDEQNKLKAIQETVESLEVKAAKADSLATRYRIETVWQQNPVLYRTKGVRKKLSQFTVECYESRFKRFAIWAKEQGLVFMDQVTPEVAREYSKHLIRRCSGATHNGILSVMKLYWDFLDLPPVWKGIRPEEENVGRYPEIPISHVLKAMERAISPEHRAMIALGAYTGMRLKDCACLCWAQIDFRANTIGNQMSKNKRWVTFPMHSNLREALESLPRKGDAIFPQWAKNYDDEFSKASHAMKKALSFDGLKYSFHSLRVTFITLCAKGGVPRSLVKEWCSHSSEAITEIYERHSVVRGGDQILKTISRAFSGADESNERKELHAMIDDLPDEAVTMVLERAQALRKKIASKQTLTA